MQNPALFALYRAAAGNWRDRLVRFADRTVHPEARPYPYSHVELLRTPPASGAAWCISASKRDRRRVRAKKIEFKPGHWDFVVVPSLDAEKCWWAAREYLGLPYDTLGAVLTVTPLALVRPGLWFCSELAGRVAGMDKPHRLTPGLFAAGLFAMGGSYVRQPSLGGATHLAGQG